MEDLLAESRNYAYYSVRELRITSACGLRDTAEICYHRRQFNQFHVI